MSLMAPPVATSRTTQQDDALRREDVEGPDHRVFRNRHRKREAEEAEERDKKKRAPSKLVKLKKGESSLRKRMRKLRSANKRVWKQVDMEEQSRLVGPLSHPLVVWMPSDS